MRFIVAFIIGAVTSEMYFMWFESMVARGHIDSLTSYGDVLVYFFKGMKEFHPGTNAGETMFEVPVGYLLIGIVLAIIIGGHIVKDLYGYGKNRLVRYTSRMTWWIKACVWNICTVVKYYLSLHAGILIICVVQKNLIDFSGRYSMFYIHENIAKAICSTQITGNMDMNMLLVMIIILPLIMCIAISLLQMMLEFLVIPSVSFIIILAIYISSAFYMRWYMVGNYLMVYRMQPVNADGVGLEVGIIVAVIISVISVVLGYMKFKKHDIV